LLAIFRSTEWRFGIEVRGLLDARDRHRLYETEWNGEIA